MWSIRGHWKKFGRQYVGFVNFDEAAARLRGRTVAIVGSAPSCLDNTPGFVDSHDVVVRVNNYKVGPAQGLRCDVHYSFYGHSIRKTAQELQHDGVSLFMCKCPNDKPIESEWHEANGRTAGIDFRYIYVFRKSWWFCDTYVPDIASFLAKFNLLGRLLGKAGAIKAGSYEVSSGISQLDLLEKLTAGDVTQSEIVFIEGWTFRQM